MPENPLLAFLLETEDIEPIADEFGLDYETARELVLKGEAEIGDVVYVALTESVWRILERNRND